MTVLTGTAHAKLNLTLDVLGRRSDGYHDLRMVMQEITLGDTVTLTLGTGKPWSVVSGSGEVPCDARNLAVKAARLFFRASGIDCGGLTVELKKQIPVSAGMGGGSANGAAVLGLLYEHFGRPIPEPALYRLAEETGSDVPFALFGGTALAEEKGQVLHRLPAMPSCRIVLCKPPFPISTPELFRAIDAEAVLCRPDTEEMLQGLREGNLQRIARSLGNVFYPVVARQHGSLEEIRETMRSCGALGAAMTGSGPTMFALFEEADGAKAAYDMLKARYSDTFLTEPV